MPDRSDPQQQKHDPRATEPQPTPGDVYTTAAQHAHGTHCVGCQLLTAALDLQAADLAASTTRPEATR